MTQLDNQPRPAAASPDSAFVVGGLQLRYPAGETVGQRVERVVAELRNAPRLDLVVLPELWDVGYFAFDRYAELAQPLADGPLASLQEIARERACVLVAGSVLERNGDRLHNTIALVGPDGSVVAAYRKMHLFSYQSQEAELLTAGHETVVADTLIGRVGLATCFDLRFPDQFARMRSDGADVFVVPAAWPAARAEHWRILARARAIETQTPIVACNGVGPCDGVDLAGESLVLDAKGNVLADGGVEAGWVVGRIDNAETREWRRLFPISGSEPS